MLNYNKYLDYVFTIAFTIYCNDVLYYDFGKQYLHPFKRATSSNWIYKNRGGGKKVQPHMSNLLKTGPFVFLL